MFIKCPNGECKSVVAFVDNRTKEKVPIPQNGSRIEVHPGVAPRIRCGRCKMVAVQLKGIL